MDHIKKQYKDPVNLQTRISIHEKYSTNKQPFGDWIFSHYEIRPGYRILELGCGTADMWKGKFPLAEGANLTLTDFSSGMLEKAKNNTEMYTAVSYRLVDIQCIPYADHSFDMVIANMMLYHVPDLNKALSEVRRVLAPGGVFYCATYGEHGIMEYVNKTLADLEIHGSIGKTFTLQDGAEKLENHFDDVKMYTREDGLEVTNIRDFVDYVLSMSGLTGITHADPDRLYEVFQSNSREGILYIPKEYGMFICK